MTNLASNVSWGTSPTNYFDFAYESERVQSIMRYKLQITCHPLSGTAYFGYPIYLEIALDGTVLDTHTLKAASPRQWSDALAYTTGWLEVSKATGTTALTIRIYSGSGSTRNTKYSYSLPVIATASTVSATDANIGSTCSIIISRSSQSLRHTLSYCFTGQDSFTVIKSKTDQTVVAWTVPTSTYNLIPDAAHIRGTIKCDTYSGDTLIGTSECKMIASASESECAPTVSATAVDSNTDTLAVTGDNNVLVKGYSDLQVAVTAEAKHGAAIQRITATCGSKTADATSGTAVIENADGATVTITAKDSRGFSTTYTISGLTSVNYTPCWIVPEITRPDPTSDSITLSVTGSCFVGAIGQAENAATLRLRTKKSGGAWSAWQTVPMTIADGKITAAQSYNGFDYASDYTAQVEVCDLISSSTRTVQILRGVPIFDWGDSDFTFNVPIRGTAAAGGSGVVIESGLVIRNGAVYILGDITAVTGGQISFDALEIILNGHKLSDILAQIGLS